MAVSKGKEKKLFTEQDIPNPIEWLHENAPPEPDTTWGSNPAVVVHYGVTCSGPNCNGDDEPIKGVRYSCTVCRQTDFCGPCLTHPENSHDRAHPLWGCLDQAIIADHDRMTLPERKRFYGSANGAPVEFLTLNGVSSAVNVVELRPGKSVDTLQCSDVRPIKPDEQYEAITCTLFDHGPTLFDAAARTEPEVFEDMIVGDGFLPIPVRFRNIVRASRSEEQDTVLYVDQLCAERTHIYDKDLDPGKVAKVYSNATRTTVWIGEEDEHTESAIGLIEQISCLCPQGTTEYPTPKELGLQLADVEPDEWTSLLHYYARPAFGNGWTCQQITLACDPWVRCGSLMPLEWWKVAMVAEMLCQTAWVLAQWRIRFDWNSIAPLRANCIVMTQGCRKKRLASAETRQAAVIEAANYFKDVDARDAKFPFAV